MTSLNSTFKSSVLFLVIFLLHFFSIKAHCNSDLESALFYVEQGENYLVKGDFNTAIDYLSKGYELSFCEKINELKLRSLFAAMLAYVSLSKEEEALQVSQSLEQLLGDIDCTSCNQMQLCHNEEYVIGPEREPYSGWCTEAVNTTAAALKGVIRAAKLNLAAREALIFTTEKFQQQALSCCARGGLWKACVGPLAKKLYEWRALGIPPDPAWD